MESWTATQLDIIWCKIIILINIEDFPFKLVILIFLDDDNNNNIFSCSPF